MPFMEMTSEYETITANTNSKVAWWMQAPALAVVDSPIPAFQCPSDTLDIFAPRDAFGGTQIKGAKINYGGNGGPLPTWSGPSETCQAASLGTVRKVDGVGFHEITDGLSNTLLVGETSGVPSSSFQEGEMASVIVAGHRFNSNPPTLLKYASHKLKSGHKYGFNSFHPNLVLFVFSDGSVQSLPEDIGHNHNGAGKDATSPDFAYQSSASRGVLQKLSHRSDGNDVGSY